VRVYVTALPKRGGISTSEFQLTLPRIPRQWRRDSLRVRVWKNPAIPRISLSWGR